MKPKTSLLWLKNPSLAFILIFTLTITMGDAIMSYATPVYMESILKNTQTMGVVFATSSFIGILADLFFGSIFKSKNSPFFFISCCFLGLLFPLTFILTPPKISTIILSMAIWGIYYEMIRFGNFKFIPRHFEKRSHPTIWGLITVFAAISVTLSPPVASKLLEKSPQATFIFSIPFYLISLFITLIFFGLKNKHKHTEVSSSAKDIFKSAKAWKIFLPSIWPILLFIFTLSMVDSAFWTIGAILSENLKNLGPGLLLFLYSSPSLFVGLFASRLGSPFGKKRIAFISGAISGLLMIFMGLTIPTLLLIFTFISSIFISISWPEIDAVIEDFVARAGKEGSDLVGFDGLSINLGYVIGPIFAGTVAQRIGIQQTFSIFGIVLVAISLLALISVPRKVHLPQKQLKEV